MSFWFSRKKQKKDVTAAHQANSDPNTLLSPYTQAWQKAWEQFLLENPSSPPSDANKRDIVVCGEGAQSLRGGSGVGDPQIDLFDGDQEQSQWSEEGSDQ